MSNRYSPSAKKISKDLKELVITRLDVLPPNKIISIGSSGAFTKTELIEHVKKEDEIGQKIVEIEVAFLLALKKGIVLDTSLTEQAQQALGG